MDLILGIDLGGSSIKAGAVDPSTGHLVGALDSVPTPPGATVEATQAALAELIGRFPQCQSAVGMAFPSVVVRGIAHTAANIDQGWLGCDAAAVLKAAAGGRPSFVVNDADAAGVAEMHFGAGRGEKGAIMMVTLGTGIGTALFIDGHLWPNTELGHMEVNGVEAEHYASARVRTNEKLDWPAWCERVNKILDRYHALLWPDLFIVGGGVSERFEEYGPLLRSKARIVPAGLRQAAGVVGAAMYAHENSRR
jgi:polyphosphate glucokinase